MSKIYEVLLDNAYGELIEVKQRVEHSISEIGKICIGYEWGVLHLNDREHYNLLYSRVENDTRTIILGGENLIDAAIMAAKFWGKLKGLH